MTPTQPGDPTERSGLRAVVVSARGPEVRAAVFTAAAALGVVVAARFVLGLLALVGSAIGYSVTAFPSGFAATPVGQFLGGFAFYPFPFYLAAFIVLVLVRPIRAVDALPTVLRQAAVAGVVGTAALVIVGIVPGVMLSIDGGTWVNLALYLTTIPLSAGVVDTALLVVGAVLAWLWVRHDDGAEALAAESVLEPSGPGEPGRVGESDPDESSVDEPVVSPARPDGAGSIEPEAPSPVSSAADDWSRFAPPAADRESDR